MSKDLQEILKGEENTEKAFILVTGAFNSGKSTFLMSASEQTWMDATGFFEQPFSYPLGCIRPNDQTALFLVETPGARSWTTLFLDMGLSEQASFEDYFVAIMVISDSTKPETFRDTKSIIETFRAYPSIPFILLANKQDHPDAWTPEELREAIRLEEEVPLLPCVTTDIDSVKQGLLALLERIPNNHVATQVAAKLRATSL